MGSFVCERGERSREANEVVRVERAFRAKKKKTSQPRSLSTPNRRGHSPFNHRVSRVSPRSIPRSKRTSAIRHVRSRRFLLTGTSACGTRARGGGRAARKRPRRVGVLSREASHATPEPKDVPTVRRVDSAYPPRQIPRREKTACPPSFDIFRARSSGARRESGRDGARVITRTRRVGRRYAHHGSYLAEGLGHVVHGSVGVHHGVLQQTSRGIQRKGRFVVRLGWVVRALRGERPERDPLGAERAAGGDRARGGAAKGEHRKGKRLGRAPLRARVNAKRQTVKDPAVVARETSGTSISFMS
jgi:hypothetical protein